MYLYLKLNGSGESRICSGVVAVVSLQAPGEQTLGTALLINLEF
jgi:hypothetical protein